MKTAKDEVLRYLGCRGMIPAELDSLIDESVLMMGKAADLRHISYTYDICRKTEGVFLNNTGITLRGKDIRRHLEKCERVILFAATLSVFADNLIRRYELVDITHSLILDACANQLIEQYCDDIQSQICKDAAKSGHMITSRFSPGYGDLPLDIQPDIISVLDAERKIGLTCTKNLLLIPRKSITAVIGLGKNLPENHPESYAKCDDCSLGQDCNFRKQI